MQIVYLTVCVTVGALIGSAIGYGIAVLLYGSDTVSQISSNSAHIVPGTAAILRLTQGFGSGVGFIGGALFFSYRVVHEPSEHLKTTKRFSPLLLLMAFIIMITSQPFMQALINLNQQMTLPDALKGVERWMRESEDTNQNLIEAMLKMNTIGDL